MQERLLEILRCPACGGSFDVWAFERGTEVESGVLHCAGGHFFPIYLGIPRLLPNSLKDYWPMIADKTPKPVPGPLAAMIEQQEFQNAGAEFDKRTKANFSNEWDNHEIGGKTWAMDLDDRVQWFFVNPLKIPRSDLAGKLMLDAGCGNGSQSVAYTKLGLEVVALDLSTGLEKGQAFKLIQAGAMPEKVHFVQADLQNPPLKPGIFDIIHSAGVLHHTPDTLKTFQALRPLLKLGGTFYVWLYKFENIVTPIVNSIRAVTTRIPAPVFAKVANLTSVPFIGFCWSVNKLGIREYVTPTLQEATLALHDIFGAPYAHYHSFEEVSEWYRKAGFDEIWACNEGRRGFGVCGRLRSNGSK